MRNKGRIYPLCVVIAALWLRSAPDLRFMQLINNFMVWKKSDCFYMEDDDFLTQFKTFMEGLEIK